MGAASFSEKALVLLNDREYLGEPEEPSVCHTSDISQGECIKFCLKVDEGEVMGA